MQTEDKIHPSIIEQHAKVVAWNNYIIEHLGLRIEKESHSGFRSMSVYQGSFCLYHNWTVNIKPTTNAEMHRYLRTFLESYLQHFLSFKEMAINPDFHPPDI